MKLRHAHTGHYLYKDRIYVKRTDVLDEMIRTRDYSGRMSLYFNDDVFDSLSWHTEINVSLDKLYTYRAQQLRDKYKYLILAFSGGSDSVQVLNTFLKNNIFIDEIITCHHSDLIKNIDESVLYNSEELSTFLEYKYATTHYLKKIKEQSPNTKITVLDLSNFLYEQLVNKKFGHMGGDQRLTHTNSRVFATFPRSYMHSITLNLINRDTAGMALIRGVDKPILKIRNDNLFFFFSDITMHGAKHFNTGELDHIFSFEDFFWSRDMPLIPIRQSQVIKKKLEMDKMFYMNFCFFNEDIDRYYLENRDGYSSGGDLERLYSNLIYPDHNPLLFAAPKPKKKSPEFTLMETVVGRHFGKDFLNELRQEAYQKYDKIVYKDQLNKFIYSKKYHLGKIEPKWS
jgi:hypothetical protein